MTLDYEDKAEIKKMLDEYENDIFSKQLIRWACLTLAIIFIGMFLTIIICNHDNQILELKKLEMQTYGETKVIEE